MNLQLPWWTVVYQVFKRVHGRIKFLLLQPLLFKPLILMDINCFRLSLFSRLDIIQHKNRYLINISIETNEVGFCAGLVKFELNMERVCEIFVSEHITLLL